MYYLLGYRLFGEQQDAIEKVLSQADAGDADVTSINSQTLDKRKPKRTTWLDSVFSAKSGHFGKSQIFHDMDEAVVQQVNNVLFPDWMESAVMRSFRSN